MFSHFQNYKHIAYVRAIILQQPNQVKTCFLSPQKRLSAWQKQLQNLTKIDSIANHLLPQSLERAILPTKTKQNST